MGVAPAIVWVALAASVKSTLAVPLYHQLTNCWCWATAGQMVMSYLGETVEQCEELNRRFGIPSTSDPTDCCSTTTPPPFDCGSAMATECNSGGVPDYGYWGFTTSYYASWGGWPGVPTPNYNPANGLPALTFDQIRTEIDAGRPVTFSKTWPPCSDADGTCGGHVLNITGYSVHDDGSQWVRIHDPWGLGTSGTGQIYWWTYTRWLGEWPAPPADAAAAHCSNEAMDADETGVDCGGADCNACISYAAHCLDMMQDGSETDVDCGGGDCAPCGGGAHCAKPADCSTSLCAPSCTTTGSMTVCTPRCTSKHDFFVDSVHFQIAKDPSWPSDFQALPLASYQQESDIWTHRQYAPETLAAYVDGGGAMMLAGAFQPTGATPPDPSTSALGDALPPMQPVALTLDFATFKSAVMSNAALITTPAPLGYRPGTISVLDLNGNILYTAVFVPRESPYYRWASGLDAAGLTSLATSEAAAGHTLVDLTAYDDVAGLPAFAAVWANVALANQYSIGIDAATLGSTFMSFTSSGNIPARFVAYDNGGKINWAVLWTPSAKPFFAYTSMMVPLLKSRDAMNVAKGYLLSDVTWGDGVFSGVWVAP